MRVTGVEIGNDDLCVLAADVWKSAAGTRRIDVVVTIGAAHLYDADGKERGEVEFRVEVIAPLVARRKGAPADGSLGD